ncbi:hypothetical protein ACB092_05G102500 [Castanea dentata]
MVNNLAFSNRNRKLSIISCGEDRTIKVWDAVTGNMLYTLEEHEAPVYSVCPHPKLFICGTSNGGESYLVEWNKCKEAIKRVYHGLWKQSVGVVQFDTMKSRFLATGDESKIKFWDMDKGNILTTTAAEGGLPVSPCIQFNKEGVLLAVSTSEKESKYLQMLMVYDFCILLKILLEWLLQLLQRF